MTFKIYISKSKLLHLFQVCIKGEKAQLKSRSSKNPELDGSNLHKNSHFGREFVQKSGVQIPVGEGQFFLFLFLFIFILIIKNCISFSLTIF